MQQKVIYYNNNAIAYSVTGNGPAVLLIHGFGEDSSIWEYQVEKLQSSFKLILPDLPGSGRSPVISKKDDGELTIDMYAKIVKSILTEEEVAVCTMIGHSMGGYVTLAFADYFPDMLNGLGLFHSTAYADTEERIGIRKKGIAFIQKYGAREFLKQSIPNLFGKNFSNAHPQEIEKLIHRAGNFSNEALVQYYEAMIERPDRTDVLKNFLKPVLFIIGEEDKSVYLQDSLNQCHTPLLSLINILPAVAHMGMWELKDHSTATLTTFINFITDV